MIPTTSKPAPTAAPLIPRGHSLAARRPLSLQCPVQAQCGGTSGRRARPGLRPHSQVRLPGEACPALWRPEAQTGRGVSSSPGVEKAQAAGGAAKRSQATGLCVVTAAGAPVGPAPTPHAGGGGGGGSWQLALGQHGGALCLLGGWCWNRLCLSSSPSVSLSLSPLPKLRFPWSWGLGPFCDIKISFASTCLAGRALPQSPCPMDSVPLQTGSLGDASGELGTTSMPPMP